jgi:DNA-binding NarL/FixJ family response regulator
VEEASALGARGYVVKAHAERELLAAIDAVLQEDVVFRDGHALQGHERGWPRETSDKL